jgi:hypothetical protein
MWLVHTIAAAGGWSVWNLLGKVTSNMKLPVPMIVLFSKLAEAIGIIGMIITTREKAVIASGASVGVYSVANLRCAVAYSISFDRRGQPETPLPC